MTRPLGARNTDHDETRTALLRVLRKRLLESGADRVSFRQLAQHAGVSVATLRHYFGSRSVLVEEVFRNIHRDGQSRLKEAAETELPLRESLQQAAAAILDGIRYGRMDRVHSLGLREGLGDGQLGPVYLNAILEPSLDALERRFQAHQDRREMASTSVRHAALAFAAPLILAGLHQRALGGDGLRPMNIQDLAADHVELFLRAYAFGST